MTYTDWPWEIYPDRPGLSYSTQASPKLCLHTTETKGYPNYSWPPHITFNPATNTGRQHVPGDLGAYALRSPGGGRSPNYQAGPVFQIEIIAYAKDTPNQSDQWYQNLAGLVGDVTANLGIPQVFLEFFGSDSYGANAPTRLAWPDFTRYTGIHGHQHVPYNTHWDPGRLDVARLQGFMEEDDMATLDQIRDVVRQELDRTIDGQEGPTNQFYGIGQGVSTIPVGRSGKNMGQLVQTTYSNTTAILGDLTELGHDVDAIIEYLHALPATVVDLIKDRL